MYRWRKITWEIITTDNNKFMRPSDALKWRTTTTDWLDLWIICIKTTKCWTCDATIICHVILYVSNSKKCSIERRKTLLKKYSRNEHDNGACRKRERGRYALRTAYSVYIYYRLLLFIPVSSATILLNADTHTHAQNNAHTWSEIQTVSSEWKKINQS